MKIFIFVLACAFFLPVSSQAVYIINCDSQPYTILVLSEGVEGHIDLAYREDFYNSSPVFSFQVSGISPVMLARPEDKFSIWKDRLVKKVVCPAKKKTNVIGGMIMMR